MPAPAWVADRLAGVSEGDLVHVRRRVTTIDGVVNQSTDSYFAVATGERNPDLLTGRGAGGHIARINAVSPVTEIQEEIIARMPANPEAARLGIPEGTPVFDVIRTYHTPRAPSASPGLSSAPIWPPSTTVSPSPTRRRQERRLRGGASAAAPGQG